jgi:hypothetical protein
MRRLPTILTTLYLILVLLAVVPIFTGDDPLSGIFAVLLTAPWAPLLDRLLPLSGSMTAGLLLVALGAAINAAIIYFVTRWLVERFAKPPATDENR